jgi:uncharacterized protein
MSLKVNLRHLEDKDLELEGEIEPEELDIDPHDKVIRVRNPLRYKLVAQLLEESLLVEGRIEIGLECDCVRCLKRFEHLVALDPWALHVPLQGDDAAPVINDLVDLTPYAREDILLDFPQHPLCSSECGGLPKSALDKAKRAGTPEGKRAESPAWGALNKLKLK